MALAGGWSGEKPADADVQAVFESAEGVSAVAAKLGSSADGLTVQAYKTQVVAGLKYKVKASIGGKSYIITAFKPLPHTGNPLDVQSVQEGDAL